MKKTPADAGGRKAKVKKQSKPRDTRDARDTRHEETEPLLRPFDFAAQQYNQPKLGVAKEEAEFHEGQATEFAAKASEALALGNHERTKEDAIRAKKHRERAEWWRSLEVARSTNVAKICSVAADNAHECIDILLACAEKCTGKGPLWQLETLLFRLHLKLHALAAHGDKAAGRMLMNLVHQAISDFECLALEKPDLFRDWARRQMAIPGHISRHPEKHKSNLQFLERLQQGEDCPIGILPAGKGNKWSIQTPVNEQAVRLVLYIEQSCFLYEADKARAARAGRELPAWRHDAMKLEPFALSPETRKAWAEIGWKILLEATDNKPGEHPALRSIGESASKKKPKYCKTLHKATADSNVEAKIKSRLFEHFQTIRPRSPGN